MFLVAHYTKSFKLKSQVWRVLYFYFLYFSEKIFGYKDLEIKIVYNETSGHCLVKIDYTSIVSDTLGLVADDVWNKLRKALPEDFSRDSFEYSKIHKNKEVYLKAFGIPKYQFACQIGSL